MDITVPTPTKDVAYLRDECLFQIAQAAMMQMRQDALGIEQEDLALASRLNAINVEVDKIRRNDPLLK